MLSVPQAQTLVRQHAAPREPVVMSLGPSALGLILAESIASDMDMPPFDKACVDGYAVRSADLAEEAPASWIALQVVEEIHAGYVASRTVGQGQAARIMTGAGMPAGADAVVMQEKTRSLAANRIEVPAGARPGLNVMPRGHEMRAGQVILEAGMRLRPQELGLLASAGAARFSVIRRPKVAVLSTGDELVPPEAKPGPGQIRNSNSTLLCALIHRAEAEPIPLGQVKDDPEALRRQIEQGLQHDMLLLSGGVSVGQADLVPKTLESLDVQSLFHKVAMKPGKPVWFGRRGASLIFGLPGNPLSCMVGFELFVRPALRGMMGLTAAWPAAVPAVLEQAYALRSDRPAYYPALLAWADSGWRVRVLPWSGSSDLRAAAGANALISLPAGEHDWPVGSQVDVIPLFELS